MVVASTTSIKFNSDFVGKFYNIAT